MILVDFIGGSHGNFLSVCVNRLAGIVTARDPFTEHGSSHDKSYLGMPEVFCGHWTILQHPLPSSQIISVRVRETDLLTLSQISLLRAGDAGLDNDKLHIDTWNKLGGRYQHMRDQIYQSFFRDQICDAYAAVRDPSWPQVTDINDWQNLPDHIRQECEHLHKLKFTLFDADHVDCDRGVLREFFELGFVNPDCSGFMQAAKKMIYPEHCNVFDFEYAWFYNQHEFTTAMQDIAEWAQFDCLDRDFAAVSELWSKFIHRQPYCNSRSKCLELVDRMINDAAVLPKLTLLEEAFVNAEMIRRGHERRY